MSKYPLAFRRVAIYNDITPRTETKGTNNMKMTYCITYAEAVDAGTVLIDHWLDSIENGFFTFSNERFKTASINNLTRAKRYLIETYEPR